jgi:hypothetical protein
MRHITGIPRNQMVFSSLEDAILPENPVRFIDALPYIFYPHVLLRQFALWARGVKIRHYGFLSSTWKREKLKVLQEKLQIKVLEKVAKKAFLPKCPCCKTGNLHRIAVFDQRGPPAWYLGSSHSSSSYES